MNLSLPGGTYVPGQVLHLRFQADGHGAHGACPGKAWFGAAAEPAAWRSRPRTPRRRSSGPARLGVHAYVSSSATNAPFTVTADNLHATTQP